MNRDFFIITLADLEFGAALLSDPGAPLRFKNPERWQEFGRRVADALRRNADLHVRSDHADKIPYAEQWRVPLPEAPNPWRARITNALTIIASRHADCSLDPKKVLFVF